MEPRNRSISRRSKLSLNASLFDSPVGSVIAAPSDDDKILNIIFESGKVPSNLVLHRGMRDKNF
jgi:hypothetical protein